MYVCMYVCMYVLRYFKKLKSGLYAFSENYIYVPWQYIILSTKIVYTCINKYVVAYSENLYFFQVI